MTVEIGLRLVEFGVIAVGPAVYPPIDGLQGISGNVLPVVREFRTETPQRTAVTAHPQPLDHLPGDQFEVTQFLKNLRVEVLGFRQSFGHLSAQTTFS